MESKSHYAKITALAVFQVAIGLIYGTANSQETEIIFKTITLWGVKARVDLR